MSTKTNGILNFLYRIFIQVDDINDESPLSVTSSDEIEAALAKSQEELDGKWDSHFSSSSKSGKGKFKVDESQLNKEEKGQDAKKEVTQELSQEQKEDDELMR